MTAEERMSLLKAAGINTDNFVMEIGKMTPGSEIKIVIGADGTPQLVGVTDESNSKTDPVMQEIFANGYVRNTKLHRRFVLAQMWEALHYKHYEYKRDCLGIYTKVKTNENGFEAWLKRGHNYMYTFDYLLDEVKVLWKLQESDDETFRERRHFFSMAVIKATCRNYLNQLEDYCNTLKIKHCKGVKYITIGGQNIFLSDLQKKLFFPISREITHISESRNYRELYYMLGNFIRTYVKRYKLPEDTRKCRAWVEAYKGAGAYYSLKNMLQFHDCYIENYETGEVLKGYVAVKYLESNLERYEGWQYMAQLKRTIEINHFDLVVSIEKQKQKEAKQKNRK